MTESATIDNIKANHTKLYGELKEEMSKFATPFAANPDRRKGFLIEVDSLLRNIESESPNVKTMADYYWLSNAATIWQMAFTTVLKEPKYIPTIIPPETFSGVLFTKDQIDIFVEQTAHDISRSRRLDKALRALHDAMRRFEETSELEQKADWLEGEVYFASHILQGQGDLWVHLSLDRKAPAEMWKYFCSDTLYRLESVWLRDVLRLHAYKKWEERGRPMSWDPEVSKVDYLNACEEFRQRLREKSIKFSQDGRREIARHFSDQYLSDQDHKFDLTKDASKILQARKAARIFELTGNKYHDENWLQAEEFVTLFYNNVFLAIEEDNGRCKKWLSRAFALSESPGYTSIMNCLEAVVFTYCVDVPDV